MQKLRNIAIIAHVDHGKTTLVDKMILAGHILRDNAKPAGELILDNNDLERERGITILSKNVSVIYKDYKINIIDTPGHADFGGEVERVLNMCDGVLLLVDAFEGTMPQTRFVLQKALALGKKPIVVINKVDKPNCRPEVVNEQVFDLMFSLDATEEQLDYKTIYGSAKQGWMSHKWNEPTDSIVPLLDAIIDEIPEPAIVEGTPQMLVTSLEYSSYTGRIAVGKVTRGSLKSGQMVTLAKRDGVTMQKTRIKELMIFEGLGKKKVEEVPCGEICAIMGIDGFEIGDTVWLDKNGNGLQDYGEPGLAGVALTLLRVDGDGQADIAAQTVSDEYGYYHFRNLRPGSYSLRVELEAGDTLTFRFGAPLGEIDSDIDPETGVSDVFRLQSGETRLNIDVGLTERAEK